MQTTTLTSPAAAFWDRIAQKYARKPVGDQVAYEAKLRRMRSILQLNDRLLEIGCGTGSTAIELAPAVARYVATDISGEMLRIARDKLAGDGSTEPIFVQAGAENPVEGCPFDVICAFSLLHLVDDIPGVLNRVREQLRPGGLFVSKTVCLLEVPFPIRIFVKLLTAVGIAPPVAALTRRDLERHLEDAGFVVEDVSYFTSNRLNPFIVARRQ